MRRVRGDVTQLALLEHEFLTSGLNVCGPAEHEVILGGVIVRVAHGPESVALELEPPILQGSEPPRAASVKKNPSAPQFVTTASRSLIPSPVSVDGIA